MMTPKFGGLLLASIAVLAASHAHATSGSGSEALSTQMRLRQAERDHQQSLARIASNMTLASAVAVLRREGSNRPLLVQVLNSVHGGSGRKFGAGQSSKHLRATSDPSGYAGLDKARNMLNEMIEDTKQKYDDKQEICCEEDRTLSYDMEVCQQNLAVFDEKSAAARRDVLEADGEIATCGALLPPKRDELVEHKEECVTTIAELNRQLSVVMADVAIMDSILGMTTCDAPTMLLLSCKDECTGESVVSFGHKSLQTKASQLQSSTLKQLLGDTLAEAYGNSSNSSKPTELPMEEPTLPPKTMMTRSSPCKLPKPTGGSGSNAGKCSISSNINCDKMQNKFENIKCGIEDKQAQLEEELARKERDCQDTTEASEAEITALEVNLKTWQTNLAAGVSRESNAKEGSRKEEEEKIRLDTRFAETTKECHAVYRVHENDLCALTKIRTELYKMKGDSEPAFFQDCEVSEWVPEECSMSCAGGVQVLKRTITTHPVGGAACPKLLEQIECNMHKCPVDCKIEDWGGWSSCNVGCGGGVMTRMRSVDIAPLHGGMPCEDTSQSVNCNLEACDANCELSDWQDWGICDKQCDWGLAFRRKVITVPSVGKGKCAPQDDKTREQEKSCNKERCIPKGPTLVCESKLDVVVILDGSGSLGSYGWQKTKEGAKVLVNAFRGNAGVRVALILFSRKAEVELHLSFDMDKAVQTIDGMQWPRSITYTNRALDAAKTELSLASADAESVVIMFTDGRPTYFWWTILSAWGLKHFAHARLMVVPVTKYAPMSLCSRIASRPTLHNVVKVDNWDDLNSSKVINRIISDVCRKVDG